jgi:hypothetical protein
MQLREVRVVACFEEYNCRAKRGLLTLHQHPESSILVWPVPLAQVLPHPQLIFPCKTWFFGIYFSFYYNVNYIVVGMNM